MLKKGNTIAFIVPPSPINIIRDYAGGLGFERTANRHLAYYLPPIDLVQLATCIRPTFESILIDAEAEGGSINDIKEKLAAKQVDAVVVKVSLPTLISDTAFLKALKNIVRIRIARIETEDRDVLNQIFDYGEVNLCLIAECETNISKILEGVDKKGTAYLDDNRLLIDNSYIPVSVLDELPLPDRGILNNSLYNYPKLGNCATILSSRGCPYSCGYYCPYPLTQGKNWRAKSAKRVIEEIQSIRSLGVRKVLFRDAVFTLDVKRAAEICDSILSLNLDIEWWCETRADKLPAWLIQKFADAGCEGINIGVESGDPKLRHAQLKRGVSDELLKEICEVAETSGIRIAFLLMVGFPGETRKSITQTAELLLKCRPDAIGINFPVAYPGTAFNDDAKKRGWKKREFGFESMDGSIPTVASDTLPLDDMIFARRELEILFNLIRTNKYTAADDQFRKLREWAKIDQ